MRQAGILAAAGLYALDHHVERLADDHANARFLADGLAALPAVRLDPVAVETNIVIFAVDDAGGVARALGTQGIEVSWVDAGRLRMVTHLDVDRAGCERALAAIDAALAP
jgi:threonine aldolase